MTTVATAMAPATTAAPAPQAAAASAPVQAVAPAATTPTPAPTAPPAAGAGVPAPAAAPTPSAVAPAGGAPVDVPGAAPGTVPVAPATTAAPKVNFPLKPATTAEVAKPVGHAAPPQADAGSIGGALFSLVLVVALILGLGWLARRMPGLQRGSASSRLRVVASVALGPRERAMVVDVGGTQLLLGVGQGGVRTLHVLEHPLPEVEAPNAPSPFAQVLAQHFGRKS